MDSWPQEVRTCVCHAGFPFPFCSGRSWYPPLFFEKTKKRQSHRISTKVLILNAPPMGDVHAKNQRPSSKNGLVRAGLRLKSIKNAVFRPFLTHHRLRWPRMMLKRPPFFGKFDSDRFPFFGHLSSSSGSRDTDPCPLLY